MSKRLSGTARFAVYFVAANAIGALFLWLAARELPVDEIVPYLREADLSRVLLWSAVFVLIYAVCHGSRVFRWRYLVDPLGEVEPRLVHRVCAVGFTAILLLPLRLGELVRPYLLSVRSRLPMSGLLGTAVVERVVDGLLMTGLLFVTLATYAGPRGTQFAQSTAWVAAAIFLPALSVCLMAIWRRRWTIDLLRRLGEPISASLTERVTSLLDDFIAGFQALLKAQHLGRFLGMTLLYWGTNILSLWVLARFGFGLEISLWGMSTVLPILVIGIMIPAGPALAGNFEYFMLQGMALFVATSVGDVGPRVAVFAATVHLLQFVVIVVPGFLIMWSDPGARRLMHLSQNAQAAVPGGDAEGAPQDGERGAGDVI